MDEELPKEFLKDLLKEIFENSSEKFLQEFMEKLSVEDFRKNSKRNCRRSSGRKCCTVSRRIIGQLIKKSSCKNIKKEILLEELSGDLRKKKLVAVFKQLWKNF